MATYKCEKCCKEFKQKSAHTRHVNKCKVISCSKPILKWVGGKTQILDKLIPDFPTEINNYHEIFLGGASVLFSLLSYIKQKKISVRGKIYAYDLNEPLIYVYKNIQSHHKELYEELQTLITDYQDCECEKKEINRNPQTIDEAHQSEENYYYWIRKQYNTLTADEKKTLQGSVMFIFLNKTCFRGMFRVGPNGFNVPFGHYKHPEVINQNHLDEIHDLIQGVVFQSCDFSNALQDIKEGDFVYLDPPYAPESATSFVGYTKDGFNLDQHKKLFNMCNKLSEEKKKFMMSNADVKLVRQHFPEPKYNIKSILCKRAINSKNPDSKAKEVIIKNY
jgi:DNA adenine methylase